MQHFKKFKRLSAWIGTIGTVLSGVWWIGVYLEHGWQLAHRFV